MPEKSGGGGRGWRLGRPSGEVRRRGGSRLERGSAPGPGPLLPPGYRASVTLVQKGCWTGPPTGRMLSDDHALPPDYSVVRGCATDLCNSDLMTHYSIPNLSPGEPEGGAGHGVGWQGSPPPRALAKKGRGLHLGASSLALGLGPSGQSG